MNKLKISKSYLFSLLLVIFIDSMGQGLLFPILNTLIMNPSKSILPFTYTVGTREFFYGLLVGSFFFSWFFGATLVAKASDSIGRKKGLLICLYGAFLGYILTIIGIYFSNVYIMLLGRIIAGLTAGSQAISQAAMIDISTEKTREKNIGFVLVAFGIGMIGGPAIGGFFSNSSIIPWFSLTTPFYVVLIIIIVNIIFMQVYFENSREPSGKFTFKLTEPVLLFISAFKNSNIRKLSIAFFLMEISFSGFYIYITVFLFDRYKFNTQENSIFLAIFGIFFALAAGFFVNFVVKRFNKIRAVKFCLIGLGIFELLFLVFNNRFLPYILTTVIASLFSIAYVLMVSFFSSSVDESKQGWIMGITISLFTLGAGLISLTGNIFLNININLLISLSALGLFVSVVLIQIFFKPNQFD
ncbi:MAG: TCR/Tet family MFS transporter [bacterium]|nr:TCR/Tet family MFS transporter [bacterium]